MTFEQAKRDADRRAREYGLVWHVIEIEADSYYEGESVLDLHREKIREYTAVSSHYFITHPEAKSLYESEDVYGDGQFRGGKNRKERRRIQKMLNKLLKRKRAK